MELTANLANSIKVSPFEVMAQDIDDTILLVNYYIEKSDESQTEEQHKPKPQVNDGFWDF